MICRTSFGETLFLLKNWSQACRKNAYPHPAYCYFDVSKTYAINPCKRDPQELDAETSEGVPHPPPHTPPPTQAIKDFAMFFWFPNDPYHSSLAHHHKMPKRMMCPKRHFQMVHATIKCISHWIHIMFTARAHGLIRHRYSKIIPGRGKCPSQRQLCTRLRNLRIFQCLFPPRDETENPKVVDTITKLTFSSQIWCCGNVQTYQYNSWTWYFTLGSFCSSGRPPSAASAADPHPKCKPIAQ